VEIISIDGKKIEVDDSDEAISKFGDYQSGEECITSDGFEVSIAGVTFDSSYGVNVLWVVFINGIYKGKGIFLINLKYFQI
jgi:hypothetical protein